MNQQDNKLTTNVSPRDTAVIDLNIPSGSQLTYTCRSIGYNIQFYILLLDNDDNQSSNNLYIQPPIQIQGNTVHTTQYQSFHTDSNLRVVFDNRKSLLTAKSIEYSTLIEPIDSSNSVNQRAIKGADLFFNNYVSESERYFGENGSDRYGIMALAYAAMSFLRAMMVCIYI